MTAQETIRRIVSLENQRQSHTGRRSLNLRLDINRQVRTLRRTLSAAAREELHTVLYLTSRNRSRMLGQLRDGIGYSAV